jgi:hypothetical protein
MGELEKEFIPYEQALALKELGFDEPCLGFYEQLSLDFYLWQYDNLLTNTVIDAEFLEDYECCAPLYQQAFKFFREKGYDVKVERESKDLYFGFYWTGVAWIIVGEGTYEEAELACVVKLIEICRELK